MDKAALTALKRQVGRMTEAQVRPLFDEIMQIRNNGQDCPDCKYNTGPNWYHCDEWESMVKAYTGGLFGLFHHLKEIRAHEAACPDCHIVNYWREHYAYCEACKERNERYWVYSNRLSHLAYKARAARFEVANGRKPADEYEAMVWEKKEQAGNV